MLSTQNWGKKKEGGYVHSLSSQVIVRHEGAQFSWDWLKTCQSDSEGMNFLFCFSCMQLWLYLLNCFYLNPHFLTFLLFLFSPLSHHGRVREWLCGAELSAELKPQQPYRSYL